jgi:phage terminase large subunit GpA-like protein
MEEDKKPKRTPATEPAPSVFAGGQAPPFVQGIRPLDVADQLKNASPEQVKMLMAARSGGFALWSQYSGIEVDNHRFEFDKHRYLLPIYLDMHDEVVLIKAAQMGATVYQLLFLIWWARHHNVKTGMYFPTKDGVGKLSKDRLTPLIQSNRELSSYIKDAADTIGLKQIENIHGRTSSMYLLYLGGQASKDSVPLDVVVFDEVRLVKSEDIDQALERISHSEYKVKRFMSTAGFPNKDIHARFLRGNQMTWHVKCNCLDGFIPSEVFPECIVDTGKEVYLRCPRCGMRIHDPQYGNYIAHNPKADVHSYSASQLISKFITPKEIWKSYLETTNKKEFYNAKLGRPYIDTENQPVTEETLQANVNPDIKWAYQQGRARISVVPTPWASIRWAATTTSSSASAIRTARRR